MESKSHKTLSEEELLNLAKEELLRDTKLASARAEIYGAHRWAKPKIGVVNKRFLKYMILSGKSDKSKERYYENDNDRIRDNMNRHHSSENRTDKSGLKYREETKDKHYSDDKKYRHKKRHHDDDDDGKRHRKHKKSDA